MVNALYPVISLVAVGVLLLLFQYHKTNKEKTSSYFSTNLLIIFSIAFCASDAIWGIVGTGVFGNVFPVFWTASFFFHTMASVTAYVWYRYSVIYLDYDDGKIVYLLILIPFVAIMVILILSIFNDGVYYIDQNFIYHSGNMRLVVFILQYFYFLVGLIRAIIRMNTADDTFKRNRFNTVIISLLIPMGAGIFQLWFPNAPCYAIGYLLSSVAVFTGNISAEREKILIDDSARYRDESKELYGALEALAKSYVSIHLFDLRYDKQNTIQSTPQIEFFVRPEDTAHEQIRKVMAGVSDPEYMECMVKFADTYTLPDRLKNKSIISKEFLGKNQGYCVSNFIVAERDSKGVPTKVIHAVQNIDETKRKEIEYENAIKEALENENAIYAELLQMQDTGVVVTDENKEVIVCNQKFKQILGLKSKKVVDVQDFNNVVHYDNEEETLASFEKISREGGAFEFYFWTQFEDAQRTFCLASAKRIELKNKRKYVVTSVTDITRNKQMENKLIELSETDALTGINNRGSGESKIDTMLNNQNKGMFCILDADNFKSINDSFGHTVGDKALVAIAECMKKSFRDHDIIMRLGGDEFAVYAVGIDSRKKAETVIKRFFERIDKINIPEMKGRKITVSLGAVFADMKSDYQFDDVYKKADSVMYECKRKEGNNFSFYE